MNYIVSDIEYDTDSEDIDLPKELKIFVSDEQTDGYDIENFISDKISDITGFCHKGFTTTPKIEY